MVRAKKATKTNKYSAILSECKNKLDECTDVWKKQESEILEYQSEQAKTFVSGFNLRELLDDECDMLATEWIQKYISEPTRTEILADVDREHAETENKQTHFGEETLACIEHMKSKADKYGTAFKIVVAEKLAPKLETIDEKDYGTDV